jgi:hypothetical protein
MINNLTNKNKTNNYTSPQSTHKKKREKKNPRQMSIDIQILVWDDTIRLICFEIYKWGLKRTGNMTALSKHVTHYGPWSGFPYYNLTTPPPIESAPLSSTCGCAEQLCRFDQWEHSLTLVILYEERNPVKWLSLPNRPYFPSGSQKSLFHLDTTSEPTSVLLYSMIQHEW